MAMADRLLIHIGCGFTAGPSWRNFDASPTLVFERLPLVGRLYTRNQQRFPAAVRYGDIVRRPLCPPATADAVFTSHMLEHVALDDMRRALRHILTMLKPGAPLRLIVPDLESRARAYVAAAERGDGAAAHHFMAGADLGVASEPASRLARLARMLGNATHKWMYDRATMTTELTAAGFDRIQRCRLGDSADVPELAEIEEAGRYAGPDGPELALEARRPATESEDSSLNPTN